MEKEKKLNTRGKKEIWSKKVESLGDGLDHKKFKK